MTVKPEDVPEPVLLTLLEEAPAYADLGFGKHEETAREQWRSALALTLAAWEATRPPPAPPAHQCRWGAVKVEHLRVLLTDQTTVLMQCEGCGDVRTAQLNGTWTLEEVRGGR